MAVVQLKGTAVNAVQSEKRAHHANEERLVFAARLSCRSWPAGRTLFLPRAALFPPRRFPHAMLLRLLIAVFLLGVCAAASCSKEPRVEIVRLDFEAPLRLGPVRPAYAVGDTLWLAADFSDSLAELNSPRRHHLPPERFDLQTRIVFNRLTNPSGTLSQQSGAGAAFRAVNQIGQLTDQTNRFGRVAFAHARGRYRARIGLVVLSPGVFGLSFISAALGVGPGQTRADLSFLSLPPAGDGTARLPEFRGLYYILNGGDTNLALLRAHVTLGSDTSPTPSNLAYEHRGVYTFTVR